MNKLGYRHNHICWNSKNRISNIFLEVFENNKIKIWGNGVSANVFIEEFSDLKFYALMSDDPYGIEIYGMNASIINCNSLIANPMYSYLKINTIEDIPESYELKLKMHDDCFFSVELFNQDLLDMIISSILKMHFESMNINKKLINTKVITRIKSMLFENRKCYFYANKDKVYIKDKPIHYLFRIFNFVNPNIIIE